jgi:hypothetical protein
MSTFTYPNRGRSFVRSTVLLLAVAGPCYVAGAFLHNTVSSRDSAVFARPVQAAEFNPQDPLPASGTVAPAAVEWSRSDGERISQPRECELAQGIATECVFMD